MIRIVQPALLADAVAAYVKSHANTFRAAYRRHLAAVEGEFATAKRTDLDDEDFHQQACERVAQDVIGHVGLVVDHDDRDDEFWWGVIDAVDALIA